MGRMYCSTLRCSMDTCACVRNQTGKGEAPVQCRAGTCQQGIMVLLDAGILERATCPSCAGKGWIPKAPAK